jgi:hypothetical protein
MNNRRSFSLMALYIVFLGLLLFSGHRYQALDLFLSNSSTQSNETAMIKACIAPDDEDPKGYDSVCLRLISLYAIYFRWEVMVAFINIFNSLSAPYLVYSGSLLMMFRNCGVGNSDIDFSLELGWWKENKEVLDNALVGAGFSHTLTFGSINDTWGYEENWIMPNGWKVDIFSNIMVGNIHKSVVWIGGVKYPCSIPLERVVTVEWRGLVNVRVPDQVEDSLIAMYGKNWELPMDGYRWDVDPFLTSFCTYKDNE